MADPKGEIRTTDGGYQIVASGFDAGQQAYVEITSRATGENKSTFGPTITGWNNADDNGNVTLPTATDSFPKGFLAPDSPREIQARWVWETETSMRIDV